MNLSKILGLSWHSTKTLYLEQLRPTASPGYTQVTQLVPSTASTTTASPFSIDIPWTTATKTTVFMKPQNGQEFMVVGPNRGDRKSLRVDRAMSELDKIFQEAECDPPFSRGFVDGTQTLITRLSLTHFMRVKLIPLATAVCSVGLCTAIAINTLTR